MTARVEFQPGEIAVYYRARAPKIKQTGTQWRGPCPLHEGKNDSFAVDPETRTWCCHSKCGRGGSLIDFEIELGGKPFGEAARNVRAVIGCPERESRNRIAAMYPYHDENGTLPFECVRHDPKGFSQRRPDGLDSDSHRFVDNAVLAITEKWDKGQLVSRGTPGLREEVRRGAVNELFDRLSKLGEREAYDGAKGEATLQVNPNGGSAISASYVALARFKGGSVRIQITLVRVSGVWMIQYFHVDAITNKEGI